MNAFFTKNCLLVDSAADSKLKRLKEGETFGIEKPGGESRIYIGQVSETNLIDSFFDITNNNDEVTFSVSKSDLLYYLIQAQPEFFSPKHSYRLDISNFFDDLFKKTLLLPDEFLISFVKNADKSRYYLSPTPKGSSNYTKFIRPICLPLLTRFDFIKIVDDEGEIKFYFKPIFLQPEDQSEINFEEIPQIESDIDSRQIIWYGAPGTGKSFTVNKETNKANSVRTTFHPDTDYASFVGTYKPTLQPVKPMYHNIQGREEEISYKFVPQVFLKAYVAAWKNYAENPEAPKPYYLVIEEINRGNCAQIFGDLFQLLDREEDGTSTYEIVPDTDIEKFLRDDERGFADVAEIEEFSADIKNGKILKLPGNLYIYATMNTSDQSLFPIDSAFKRRWEWRYTPIAKPAAKNWAISANGKTWSWWEFLKRINFEIGKATESEDKKLGYFFARAKKTDPADIDNNNGVIEASTFVSKVLFYLWNDVIKDNDFNGDLLRDKNGKQLDFTRFFKIVDGKTVPDEELVEQFIENIMKVELPDDKSDSEPSKDVESKNTITVNGEAVKYINAVPYTTIKKYIELHPEMSADQVNDIWAPFSKYSLRPWLTSTVQQDYAEKLICADGTSLWVNKDGWMHDPSKQRDTLQEFIDAVNASDFGVTIQESKSK